MPAKLPLAAEQYLSSVRQRLEELDPASREELFQAVVDAPFQDKKKVVMFDLGITVLLMVNKKAGTIDRIALSKTKMARGAVRMSIKPFASIKIPLDNKQNIIKKAIASGKVQETSDWHDLFVPDLSPRQARFNQSGAGIECSLVSRLDVRDGAAMIFSFYQPLENLTPAHYGFVDRYSKMAEAALNRLIDKF